MRPTRLELVGFASFRDRTEVDLTDSDLFVLTGPTGAGKSSIVDALVFALYGSVPRYDDLRAVAPVISQGKLEAKVRLDFELDGDEYTVVRVVRRQSSGGATTKEARLQRGDEVLASGATELGDIVPRLLGLPFEHFVKCVVLPQGDFAEFLHATPGDRQDLLVRLLALDLYRDIGRRANRIASEAGERVTVLDERLDKQYGGATPEALDVARARVETLTALCRDLDAQAEEVEALQAEKRDQRDAATKAGERAAALESVDVPDSVPDLAEILRGAQEAHEGAEAAIADAADELEAAQEARRKLGDTDPLRAATRALDELEELDERIEKGTALRDKAAADVERLGTEHARAAEALASARERVQDLRRHHAAAHLARELHAGDDCPVCARPVDDAPEVETPADLDEAEATAARAEAAETDAANKVTDARELLTKYEDRLEQLEQKRERVRAQVSDAPDRDEITTRLEDIATADERVEKATTAAREARNALDAARKRVASTADAADKAWTAYDRARDRLVGLDLGPPAADRGDLAAAWRDLTAWAGERAPQLRDAAKEATTAVDRAEEQIQEHLQAARRRCADLDVDVTEAGPRAAAAEALGAARARADKLETDIEDANALRDERRRADERRQVASALCTHLRSNHFESWLLNRALHRLVIGATGILRDLSSGAYSLSLNERNEFEVIDHLNADDVRPAKTLSGGETFLASLSLALALADHLKELAATGAAQLDALFLDEGFGTLDPDTLDTVTQAITELGSRGRMVGLITHVRDLADQIPVRFEVRKAANTSTVEKVVT